MEFRLLLLAFCFTYVAVSFGDSAVAPFITRCKSDDADCAKANAAIAIPLFAAGVPELGIEPLDPEHLGSIDHSRPDLKFFLRNTTLFGIKDCKPLDVHRDVPKSKLYIKLVCSFKINGQYELLGKFLSLNLNGCGTMHIMLTNFEIGVDMDLKEIDGDDSKKHFNVINYTYMVDLKEKSIIEFENILENGKPLSTESAELIKNNGNEIVRQFGRDGFIPFLKKVIKNVNNFLNAVPIEELSID